MKFFNTEMMTSRNQLQPLPLQVPRGPGGVCERRTVAAGDGGGKEILRRWHVNVVLACSNLVVLYPTVLLFRGDQPFSSTKLWWASVLTSCCLLSGAASFCQHITERATAGQRLDGIICCGREGEGEEERGGESERRGSYRRQERGEEGGDQTAGSSADVLVAKTAAEEKSVGHVQQNHCVEETFLYVDRVCAFLLGGTSVAYIAICCFACVVDNLVLLLPLTVLAFSLILISDHCIPDEPLLYMVVHLCWHVMIFTVVGLVFDKCPVYKYA